MDLLQKISTDADLKVDGTFSHLTNGYSRNDDVNLKLAILGAPGSGKSTLSAGLLYFSKLFFLRQMLYQKLRNGTIIKASTSLVKSASMKNLIIKKTWKIFTQVI